jgi:hypothetical protein
MKRGLLFIILLTTITIMFLALFMNSNFHLTGFTIYDSQPDSTTGKDTYIQENSNNTNYGSNTKMLVGKDGLGRNHKSLIEFNISSIPAGNTVVSAKLQINVLYSSSDNNITISLYRLTSPWNESEATWSNRTISELWNTTGGSYAEEVDSLQFSNESRFYNFTITNLVRNWVNGSYTNYGIILVSNDSSTGNRREIDSSDSTNSSARPKLVIDYTENAPPFIINITTDSNLTDFKQVGKQVNFTIFWNDLEGDNAGVYICNSSDISFGSGCGNKTFCSTSLSSTNPIQCSYTITSSENRTTSFFTALCDDYNCSDANQSYFYVNNFPIVLVIHPNDSEIMNQSQGNYSIKFNVSDPDDDFLLADIYYGTTQNSTTNIITSGLNLTNYCTDSDSKTSTANNCSYSFNSSELYGTYYLTIMVNDSYSLGNDSSDNSFYIRSINDNVPPNIITQWIEGDIHSGEMIQIYANITDEHVMGDVWAAINTTPQTNVTLLNKSSVSPLIFNGSWIATSNNTYQYKIYAKDIMGNLNDTVSWQTFSVRKPNATTQNEYGPSIALPFHTIKITGELNASDSLRDIHAYLTIPEGFTFLSDYPQNSYLGNFSTGEIKNATWFLSVPLTEADYVLNISYSDPYSDSWNSSNFDIQVTSAIGGGYELDVSGYPEVQTSDSYYSEAYFKQSGIYTSPDSIEVSLYDSLGNLIVDSVDMSVKQTGIYNYTYSVPSSATTGQWETRVNATKSSVSYYARQFWKLVGALFDVGGIVILDTNVSHLNISVILENKGTSSADLILSWNLTRTDTNQELDSGGATIGIGAGESITRYYSPETTYVGQVKITFLGRYSGTETAGAYEIFSTTSAGAAPPVTPGGGGGGGGGIITPVEETNLEITVDEIVYVAENIPKTISLKINNTGKKDLTNISLILEGLDEFFYTISPGTINSLKNGEIKSFDIRFLVINMSGERNLDYTIRTNEITKKESGKIIILSILDYLRKEIERLALRIEGIGSKITDRSLKADLGKCNDTLILIKSQMNDENFIDAKNNINVADECMDKIEQKISGGGVLPFDIGYFFWILIGLVLSIMIIVILIIIILYKMSSRIKFKGTQRKPHLEMSEKIMNEEYFNDRMRKIRGRLKD